MIDSSDQPGAAPLKGAGAMSRATNLWPMAASSRWFSWSLILVILLGVALRLAFLDHRYFNPDEQLARAIVQSLRFPQQWDTNWAKSDVIEVWRYDQYNFSSYHYLLYFWKTLMSSIGIDWNNQLWALRSLNGILGLLSIGAVAVAMRRLVGEVAGIAAAMVSAIMPLFVQDAHYLRCEAMLTAGVAALILLPTLRGIKSRWLFFSGGLISGWMVASKFTMGLATPLLLLMFFNPSFALRKSGRWSPVLFLICMAALGFVLGFVIGVPWWVARPQAYFSGLARLALQYTMPMPPYTTPDLAPSFLVTLAYMKGTLGWGFWIVSVFGLAGMVRFYGWWWSGVFFTPLGAALIVFGQHPFFAERSYSPFLPLAAVFFGAGMQLVSDSIVRLSASLRFYRVPLVVLTFLVTLALPAIYTWQIVALGFSEREELERNSAITQMKGSLAGKEIEIFGAVFRAQDYQSVMAAYNRNEPMLILLVDCYDANTPSWLALLRRKFGAHLLGGRESIFSGLPTCTLHTYISPRLWVLYIPTKLPSLPLSQMELEVRMNQESWQHGGDIDQGALRE